MDNIKTCTYNIRYDSFEDLNWGWSQRSQHILNMIKREDFDILGIQEALPHQLQSLKSINKYEFFGISRGNNPDEDEYNGIFYKKDRFEKIDGGYFWLSKTPDKPSFYEGAGCRRICVWIILLDKITNKNVVFCVTHLDNLSEDARIYGANLILEKLSKYYKTYPFVLMGDFNSITTDTVYKNMSNIFSEVKVVTNFNPKGTFTSDADFLVNSNAEELEIDFIFINNLFSVKNVDILRDNFNGKYISDHFPVVANLYCH